MNKIFAHGRTFNIKFKMFLRKWNWDDAIPYFNWLDTYLPVFVVLFSLFIELNDENLNLGEQTFKSAKQLLQVQCLKVDCLNYGSGEDFQILKFLASKHNQEKHLKDKHELAASIILNLFFQPIFLKGRRLVVLHFFLVWAVIIECQIWF